MEDNQTTILDGNAGPVDSKQFEAQAQELMATPGYADGKMKDTNPAGYDRLTTEITRLFNLTTATPIPTLQASSVDAKEVESQISMMQEANAEFQALQDLGFDKGRLPDQIEDYHVSAWKAQRLCAQGNFAELAPHVAKDLPVKTANTFTQFMNDSDVEPALKEQIAELVIKSIFESRSKK